ncbi:ABC transporter substrate-binding protein [Francisella sp. 19X1-34]|uniref:MlaC/ttg2D family ABC transporter substrate-binding protein n=1 Tax=Francisella sp. 19X1-34 TaxID=3087177 RepID=UPI002E3080F4|nr:ABC transporter substrate-binding protein [Francisella sp. 19X1-34]MED7787645.1 ABC transporter substrate-binding protein [Francisella sp. 19X1-34]
MIRKTSVLLFLLILSISSAWAIQNPVNMLNNTIVKTQNNLIKNAGEYKKDPYKLLRLVDNEIIPIVAPKVIAQLVVGTAKWKKATPEEQKQFIKSATEMLTFMYAKNVAYAGKYRITLFPFNKDDNNWQKKPIVVVNGKITNIDNNQSSDFAIKMFQKNGKWHIYDFDVAGVSILRTYQQQFEPYANIAEMTKAAEKVTTRIKKKNYPKLLDKNYNLQNLK